MGYYYYVGRKKMQCEVILRFQTIYTNETKNKTFNKMQTLIIIIPLIFKRNRKHQLIIIQILIKKNHFLLGLLILHNYLLRYLKKLSVN